MKEEPEAPRKPAKATELGEEAPDSRPELHSWLLGCSEQGGPSLGSRSFSAL